MINCIPFCRVWASRNLLVNCSLHPKRTHHQFCCLLMAAFIFIFVGNGSSLPTHLRPALLKSHFSPRAYSSGVIFSFVESEDKDGDLSLGPIHHTYRVFEDLSLVPPCAEVFAPVSFEPAP